MTFGSHSFRFLRALTLASTGFASIAIAGDIEGTVTSGAADQPVPGAMVRIEGTARQVTTGQDGRYRIDDLDAGRYDLRIDQPGYRGFVTQVTVPAEGNVRVDGVLARIGDATNTQIVVTGARASRQQAIQRKRNLPVIADVVASDGIGKLPDYNTAEALQRLPGVTVEIDQGEPRYVVIRGVDPNLNQVTVDGNLVGVPEAEGRRVALDTIPSDLVAAIEVIKTVTPDYDANAIGGSINIVTPTGFDNLAPFTLVSARGAYNGKSGKLGFGASATHGRRFGPDDTLGIAVGASYFKRFIDSDLVEPRNWTSIAEGVSSPTSYRFYDYRIMRERIGAIANLDWRPSSGTRFYVRTIYNEFTDEEERDQIDFGFFGGDISFPAANQIAFTSGRATREFRQNDQTQTLYNISPGAELNLGRALLELNYTFAHAEENTPVRDDIEFRSGRGKSSTLELTSDRPRFVSIDPSLYDPAAFPLRRIRIRRENIAEDLHAVRADLQIELGMNPESFVKFGGKYTDRSKDRDNAQSVQTPTMGTTLAGTGAVLPPPVDFYEGQYAFGPRIDYRGVLDFFADNPALLALDETATGFNDLSADYQISEKIYAAYGMAHIETGDLTTIAGVRVEHTDGRYDAFAIRDTDGDGTLELSDVVPLSFGKDYTHVLPSVHLIYRPASEVIIRGAWTNTIGRPNYDDTVPTFEEDSGDGEAGNPDLEPYTSMGLDLSAEFYPNPDSIVSLTLFYKQIENPIFTQTIMNTSFAGIPLVSLAQPQNADDGELFGIEANIVTRFAFLPAPFDGLGASANVTYVDSSVSVPFRADEDIPFFRQPDWIVGAALFFEKDRLEARVAIDYRDDYIVSVGSSTASDIYNKRRFTLDARISYLILDDVEVFASAANLTDETLTFFQTTTDQTFSRQIYGINADFGISARF